jgi:hypothetical protein
MVQEFAEYSYRHHRFCLNKSILIEIEWIPRSENEKADFENFVILAQNSVIYIFDRVTMSYLTNTFQNVFTILLQNSL